nr:caldesmon isoform X1 [Zonotrichia albicollis]XP_026646114.1 caldesmon isoform X1 [Zonotrichia albicollis]XP_026646115.1 caldesmon isoform X1 [Zonotrichia albicollis]
MDDFERRRELRRQKREEMRLEAERLSYQRNDDDDEEAARERRRRARQERLRQKEEGDVSGEATEKSEVNAQNSLSLSPSVAGEESKRSLDDEAALLERLARREERRQKRLQEALERQKELDPTITDGSLSAPSRREVNNVEENATTGKEETETVTKSYQRNNWRQDGEEEGKKEEKDKEEEKPKEEENQVDVTAEKPADKEEAVTVNAEEHKAENDTNAVPEGTQSVADEEKAEQERKEAEERERLKAEEEKRAAEEKQRAEEEKRAAEERAKAEEERRAAEERERAKAEEERRAAEEKQKAEEERRAAEERAKAEEEKRAAEEKAKLEAEKLKEKQKMEEQKIEEEKRQAAALKKQEEEKVEAKKEKLPEEKPQATSIQDQDDKGKAPKEEMKSVWDRKKAQNGEQEPPASKLKPTENAFGRSGAKGAAEEAKPGAEALKRLEDQRRRRGESESEELEKLKEKQQEAAAELGELKKKREERRKVLEEEEQKKKQEEAERKIREEEEKRRMKEEIEKRRAEAAEKRQKMPEDGVSEDKKPFKCLSPKGSSLKIEERTEFLNKSAQKSGMKPTQTTAVVSKIDSRLEQYTSALGSAKTSRPKASDLHVPAEGVRNIKSMWEKGNVFSSPSGTGTPNKETAGLKVGVSSRINEWLTKTPEGNKSPAPKPSDLRPGDVSGKRNLWEKQSVEKPGAASKVSATGKKSETNAGVRQEP